MAKQIQIRRDTSVNWTNTNPILAQGELGYEIDTYLLKIGDGLTAWTSLPYFTSGGDQDLSGYTQNAFKTIVVSGQSDVVADSKDDTLTLIAGSNITIETNATNDSVTISASGGASGEANTASNIGTTGVGVFKDKSGSDLRFKKINASSAKITVTDDTDNNKIDIDVVTGTDANSVAIGNHDHTGTYEPANANIQSHISATNNPHGVDAEDVGLSNVQNINWCDYVSMSTNSITITDAHKGKTIWTTSASAVSAAVASNLGMDFVCGVIQGGAGQVTFSGLGDVTIENENNHTKTSKLRSAVSLRILPDGTCKLIGETA